MALNASPMECVEVAQAVTMSMQEPCAPNLIAIWPPAMSLIMVGTKLGEIHLPLLSSMNFSSSRWMVVNPPIPEPT